MLAHLIQELLMTFLSFWFEQVEVSLKLSWWWYLKHGKMTRIWDSDRKALYEYFSALLEPWDGPALISFTDGAIFSNKVINGPQDIGNCDMCRRLNWNKWERNVRYIPGPHSHWAMQSRLPFLCLGTFSMATLWPRDTYPLLHPYSVFINNSLHSHFPYNFLDSSFLFLIFQTPFLSNNLFIYLFLIFIFRFFRITQKSHFQ